MMQVTHVPVLLVDVEGFTTHSVPERRTILRRLQEKLTDCARFFMPLGDPWDKWTRHGTGDGYYFIFDGLGKDAALVAMEYARRLEEAFFRYNAEEAEGLPLRLRMGIVLGDVETVDDQFNSEVMCDAARFVDDPEFKNYFAGLSTATGLIVSQHFYSEWREAARKDKQEIFAASRDLSFSPVRIVDKHGRPYEGRVLGSGWTAEPAREEVKPRLKILMLIGCSVEERLPEAIEMAREAASEWMASGLHVDVRVDQASVAAIRREAKREPDWLFFYGHGSEDGRLQFADGLKSYEEIGQHDTFWKRLKLAVVFACHGRQFAENLPGPWLAFDGPVWREAPKGLMRVLVEQLASKPVGEALKPALAACREEMTSDFVDLLRRSDEQEPAIPLPSEIVPKGEPIITRLNAGIAGHANVEFKIGSVTYPAHDPFVGRVAMLKKMLELPGGAKDVSDRNVRWLCGRGGLGKTALMQEAALCAQNLVFHEDGEPLYVFLMSCHEITELKQLNEELGRRLAGHYGLDLPEPSVDAVLKELGKQPKARHLWLLDDLTYITPRRDQKDDATRFVDDLKFRAGNAALTLALRVSTRQDAPAHLGPLPIAPLDPLDARELAECVYRRSAQTSPDRQPDYAGALKLFHLVGQSTALYKLSLILAADNQRSFGEHAKRLSEQGSLEGMDIEELAAKMIQVEVESLGAMEQRLQFDFKAFMPCLYDIILRAGSIKIVDADEWETDLENWFGDRLNRSGQANGTRRVYRNGLEYLVRLGLLALEARPHADPAYTLPPNQRLAIKALRQCRDEAVQSMPWRALKSRSLLLFEQAMANPELALAEVEQEYNEYEPYFDEDPTTALAVIDHFIDVGIYGDFKEKPELECDVYDTAINHFERREEVPVKKMVIKALNRKGRWLNENKRPEEAVQVHDEVLRRIDELEKDGLLADSQVEPPEKGRDSDDVDSLIALLDEPSLSTSEIAEAKLHEMASSSLLGKGLAYDKLKDYENEIAMYDELVCRFGGSEEWSLRNYVAWAMINKAVTLQNEKQLELAFSEYDAVLDRVAIWIGDGKLDRVWQLFKRSGLDFDIDKYLEPDGDSEDLPDLDLFFNSDKDEIFSYAVEALSGKGDILGLTGQNQQAIDIYDEVISLLDGRDEDNLLKIFAWTLVNKGVSLGQLNRPDEELAVYDDVIARFGSRDEVALLEQVAKALIYKGITLGQLGRSDEALAVYEDVVARFGSRDEAVLLDPVASALVNKGVTLGQLGRSDEALAVYEDVVARFGSREELALLEQVAKALVGKGVTLGEIGHPDEALAAYEDVIARFGSRDEVVLLEQVATAYNGKAWGVYESRQDEKLSDAIVFGQRALELQPEENWYRHTLASVLGLVGRWPEALEQARHFVDDETLVEQALDDIVDFFILAAASGQAGLALDGLLGTKSAAARPALPLALAMSLGQQPDATPELLAAAREIVTRIETRKAELAQM